MSVLENMKTAFAAIRSACEEGTEAHGDEFYGPILDALNTIDGKGNSKYKKPVHKLDDELRKFLKDVRGACEATYNEMNTIWGEYSVEGLKYHPDPPQWGPRTRYTWESNTCGLHNTIGYFGGMPICVSMWISEVGGHKILFYETVSMVTHSDMVRDWLKAVLPKTAHREGGGINHTDATNFCNVLHDAERRFPSEVAA